MNSTRYQRIGFLLLMLLAWVAIAAPLHGQGIPPKDGGLPLDSVGVDTLRTEESGADSLNATAGDGAKGIDTIVSFSARRIINDVKNKKLRLIGEAELINGSQRLTAHYIEIDLDGSTLYARAAYDSVTRKYTEVPVFKDNGQEIVANELTYNFKTKQATLAAAETQFQDGFYYGAHINRVTEQTIFIEDGKYTTCDAPHKHFYFASPRMKIIAGDKIFADQVALYVADVPILYMPFGLYFASRRGKQSGIILPTLPLPLEQRGVTLSGLGFFWAGNEYVDAKILTWFYSKGGYTLENTWRAKINSIKLESANLGVTYSKVRYDVDDDFTSSYIVNYGHNQQFGRRTRISGTINYTTQNAIRNSTTQFNPLNRLQDITTQNVTSNISLSTSTAWGLSFSGGYSRTQQIITNELTSEFPVSIQLPTWTPFASANATDPGPLDNLTFGYSGRGSVRTVRKDTIPGGGFRVDDTPIGFTHTPSVSFSYRLADYFTFQPSFSYTESWFRRRLTRVGARTSSGVDTVADTFETGFFRAPFMSGQASITTRLYGIIQPKVFGINAIRHTFSPTITAIYSPDYSDPRYDYYRTYVDSVDSVTNRIVQYSVFEYDGGVASLPFPGKQEVIRLSIANSIEAKIAQPDTLPDVKVTLLNLSAGVSYNAAAPGNFRWSEIGVSASTNLGTVGSLNGSATFDPYDTDIKGQRIPTTLLDNNKGLLRVTNMGVQVSTSFSDQGFTTGTFTPQEVSDSGRGRVSRFDFEQIPFDESEFFGESVRGDRDFRPPWQISLNASYSVSPDFNFTDTIGSRTNFSLSTNFSFSLTPSTRITSGGTYNFDVGKILIPSISVSKDLHCWEMTFSWVPGSSHGGGFYFKIGLKAPQLQDIKLEKKSGFY